MLIEKPKNKRKNSGQESKNQLIVLAAAIIILVATASVFMLLPNIFPTEITIHDVQRVQIVNNWTGLSQIAPIQSDYDLTMQADGSLEGTAIYSISYDPITETVEVMIPADVVTAFLEKLETVKMQQGEYTPYFAWTDDYPYAEITIETSSTAFVIYSGSQGKKNIPWGATIEGTDFTIDSGIPAEALAVLEPHLRLDVQDDLISSYNNSK